MIRKAALLASLALTLTNCTAESEHARSTATAPACAGIAKRKMLWIEGGTFTRGEAARYREEGPPHTVTIDGFWISATEVTNAQFTEFVADTGYRTEAERVPTPVAGAPPDMDMLKPGSAVFRIPTADDPNWWKWVPGANWRHPNGPGSSIEGHDNDPVVQITCSDALAYAKWAGMSLPREKQWEFAARAGGAALPEPLDPDGIPQANYYQGVLARSQSSIRAHSAWRLSLRVPSWVSAAGFALRVM